MCSDKKSDKDSRQKLAPIALGPYLVKEVDEKAKTAVIVYDDDTVENVSRSRIVRAPKQLSSAEMQSIVRPTVVSQTIANFPATEAVNLQYVLSKDDQNANEKQISEQETRVDTRNTQVDEDLDKDLVENNEFYIDTVVSHKLNRNKRHPDAKVGDILYRVRWVGYGPKDDTWEPLPNLTRSHVIRYHERGNIPLPANINTSIDDVNIKKELAINAETTQATEEQSGNTRRVNDVIEKLLKHSFDNEDNWSYLVHWYDTDNSHDTWEPLSSLPRNAIVAYHKRNQIPLPTSINHARNG